MSRTYEQLKEQQSNEPTTESSPTANLPTPNQQQLTANSDDGWTDTAAEMDSQFIRGKLLKFADWRWTKGKDGVEVEKGTQLVALGTAAAWVKWWDNKPVPPHVKREPGKKLPDREELGDLDEIPLATWTRRQSTRSVAEHALRVPPRSDQHGGVDLQHIFARWTFSRHQSRRSDQTYARTWSLQRPARRWARRREDANQVRAQ